MKYQNFNDDNAANRKFYLTGFAANRKFYLRVYAANRKFWRTRKPCGVGRADANPKLLLNDT